MQKQKKIVVRTAALAGFAMLVGCGCHDSLRSGPLKFDDAKLAELRNTLPMFSGRDGRKITWSQLLDEAANVDVIVLGEQHDDAVGHAAQLAIVKDILATGSAVTLSMEMLDRGEQAIVDDYLAKIIDREAFVERTASTRWRKISRDYLEGRIDRNTFGKRIRKIGWPDWENNYQPIIDEAKSNRARIVAANTPWARYTSLANKEGFARLEALASSQKALFELPHEVLRGPYRERFWEVMVGRREGEASFVNAEGEQDAGAAHPAISDEQVLGMFRAQLIMDATMADSIADALQDGADKVIHLVGHFHSDFEGGLVQELRHRRPGVQILTVSMQKAKAAQLRKQDRGRADVVVYTPHLRNSG
ncbi:MAG: ChaN family lipoprotein [Phycisphaerales bacterium]|nr:ChaN family lipoprotein [Phycisphaerales bacterium]